MSCLSLFCCSAYWADGVLVALSLHRVPHPGDLQKEQLQLRAADQVRPEQSQSPHRAVRLRLCIACGRGWWCSRPFPRLQLLNALGCLWMGMELNIGIALETDLSISLTQSYNKSMTGLHWMVLLNNPPFWHKTIGRYLLYVCKIYTPIINGTHLLAEAAVRWVVERSLPGKNEKQKPT